MDQAIYYLWCYSKSTASVALPKKNIPVRSMSDDFGAGIAVAKVATALFQLDDEAGESHRHDAHFFVLQEKGVTHTEIDFEKHLIQEPSILYQAPSQVHRALKIENIEMYVLVINDEHIKSDYRKRLQDITPVKPLPLVAEDIAIFQHAFSLCVNLLERTNDKLHFSLLKDCCNTLVGLFISQYLEQVKPSDRLSRFEIIEKSFTQILEIHFATLKRPSDYASMLNVSIPYLNECVRNVTGFTVSHQIQQRVMLEAKRLLFHSNKSVKEIAAALGYQDYAYFSRLFTKVTGITALAFRHKNRD